MIVKIVYILRVNTFVSLKNIFGVLLKIYINGIILYTFYPNLNYNISYCSISIQCYIVYPC